MKNAHVKAVLFSGVSGLAILMIIGGLHLRYANATGVTDAATDYIIGLIAACILSLLLVLVPLYNKRIVLLAWFCKLAIVFFVSYLYEVNRVDAHVYYQDALAHPSYSFAIFQGTATINTLVSFLNLIVPSFRFVIVIFTFVGFLGQYCFWYAFRSFSNPHFHRSSLIAIMFFPSLLFWTSILGKDSIVFFIISIYFLGFSFIIKERHVPAIICILTSFIGFLFTRSWLIAIFGSALALSLIVSKISATKKSFFIFPIAGITCAYVLYVISDFNIHSLDSFVGTISQKTAALARGDTGQFFTIASIKDYLSLLPTLSFSLYFRPLPWEVPMTTPFGVIAGIENGILFLTSCVALFLAFLRRLYSSFFVKAMLIHLLCWDVVYIFLGARNIGAGARFKIQILPFVIFLFCYIFLEIRNNHSQPNNRIDQ